MHTCCLGQATHLPPVPFQLSAHPAPICSVLFLICRLFSLLDYSLQILFKLPSSPFLLIFRAYPLLLSLNFFLFFYLNFTAQDSVKLDALWGASWGLLDFSHLQTVLPLAISVQSFLFAFLPLSSFGLVICEHCLIRKSFGTLPFRLFSRRHI